MLGGGGGIYYLGNYICWKIEDMLSSYDND